MAKLKQLRPKIDPEICGLLPQPHAEERAQLKADIEMNGLLDEGIVWKENGILLDGHTRFKICEELGIPFRYQTLSFPDRQEAIDWVYNNQLARRNVAKDERAVLIAKRVKILKAQAEAEKALEKQGESCSQSDSKPATVREIAERVAAEKKVSTATVYRAVAKVDSNFCDRCVRTGMPAKNCPKCAEKRAAKPKPKKKAPDKGRVLIDWPKFKKAFPAVVQLSDHMHRHYPKVMESGERKEYERHIAAITALWQSWEKKIK